MNRTRGGMVAMTAGAVAIALAASPRPAAQTPTFEVASVKRNNSGDPSAARRLMPGGTLFVNIPLRQLIISAYGLQPFQVIGGPSWIDSDRFDINARASGTPTPQELDLMLRSLLADRFKLVAHSEQREMTLYSLLKARDDGQLGPGLRPAAVDCGPTARGRGGPPPAPGTGAPGRAAGSLLGCRAMIAPGRLTVGGQPLSLLATVLSTQVGRPVVDKTGLTGRYDLELVFLPDGGRGGPVGLLPPGAPPAPIDPDAPSLFTALQEQLGLKLESGRGPVEVIVIDSVEPPTED